MMTKRTLDTFTWENMIRKHKAGSISVHRLVGTDGNIRYRFNLSFMRDDLWKRIPNFGNEKLPMEALLKDMVRRVKTKPNYAEAEIKFNDHDYYESLHGDQFETPRFIHRRGVQPFVRTYNQYYEIPKGWEIICSVAFDGEMSGRLRNSVLSMFFEMAGQTLDDTTKSQLKKAIDTHQKDVEHSPNPYSRLLLNHDFH